MKQKPIRQVTLNMTADPALIPLAAAFAEKSAIAFMLDTDSVLALTLATEEIVGYLSRRGAEGREVRLTCKEGVYYVEEEFLLPDQDFDLRAFNLTARASLEDEQGLDETGLIIASRMVDRFRFAATAEGLRLTLVREKTYPEISEVRVAEVKPLEAFSVRAPDPEELKVFIRMANAFYDAAFLPVGFRFPGKLVDMVASGEYAALIAVDPSGTVGGGIIAHLAPTPVVEAAGPYLFGQPQESNMAETLVEGCLGSIARTGKTGLVVRYSTPDIPERYFEQLGTLELRGSDDKVHKYPSYYRQIEEDLGTAVWCHPDLVAFLSREYARLALPRRIRTTADEGEAASPSSVIFVDLDKVHGDAVLQPVWWGEDAERNLADHLALLEKEALPNILFAMDLGISWSGRFTPILLNHGFEPRMLLPYGGSSDVVLFQHIKGSPSK